MINKPVRLSYRKATRVDMEWAYQIFKAGMKTYIEQTWGWDELFQEYGFRENLPPKSFTIALLDDEAIGGYSLQQKSDHLHLEILLIAPRWQRRGFGTEIVRHLQNEARKRRQPLRLCVLKRNPAYHLYRQLGFTVSEEDPDRYQLQWSAPKSD